MFVWTGVIIKAKMILLEVFGTLWSDEDGIGSYQII